MNGPAYVRSTYVTEERYENDHARLLRLLDMQTDALNHAFWALLWVFAIAVIAFVAAVWA